MYLGNRVILEGGMGRTLLQIFNDERQLVADRLEEIVVVLKSGDPGPDGGIIFCDDDIDKLRGLLGEIAEQFGIDSVTF